MIVRDRPFVARIATLRATAALAPLTLIIAGCGGSGSGGPQPVPPPQAAPAPTPTPPPTPAPTPAPPPSPGAFNTREFRQSSGPSYHGAVSAWTTGATGSGVTVGIIDSGVDSTSPEFAGRFHPLSTDVTGNGRGFSETAADSDGHGTNVAGVLLAARNDLNTVGIAYEATILSLRADRPGSCTDTTAAVDESGCRFSDTAIAAGVDRAVQAGARVLNISLGGSSGSTGLRQAIARAANAGVVVVVSAGNDGDSTEAGIDPNNPDPFAQSLQLAGSGLVIIAGSNTVDGAISPFSNRAGAFSSSYLSALGSRVCCDYEGGNLRREVRPDGTFVFLINGTSFAAPQIAGAAALLAQAFPNLTGRQIVDLLLRTADDVGTAGNDAVFGRGILNITRAFSPQGSSSIAGTEIKLPVTGPVGGTSGPMGDADLNGGGNAIILDGYERAFEAQLGTFLARTMAPPRLTPALAGRDRTLVAGNGAVSIALSIAPGRELARVPQAVSQPLTLSGSDAERAQAQAVSIVTRLSPRTSFGFAIERGTDGLVAAMRGSSGGAFLVADDAASMRLLASYGSTGTALRRTIAPGVALTVAAERGQMGSILPQLRVADRSVLTTRSPYDRLVVGVDGVRGNLSAALTGNFLAEGDTILGARLAPAFGSNGAQTAFADASVAWATADGWRLQGQWREGWTWARVSGLVTSGAPLRSRAWSVDVSKSGVFSGVDALSLRVAQPLRVERGTLLLNLPVDYDYATRGVTFADVGLNLAPRGREHVVEAAWMTPAFGGALTINAFWRNQPGHIAAADDDLGAAIRYTLGF
jgi:subtilisin family serine protease